MPVPTEADKVVGNPTGWNLLQPTAQSRQQPGLALVAVKPVLAGIGSNNAACRPVFLRLADGI